MKRSLKYALRILYTNPVFTLTAILSIAIGLGAVTAVFSIIHELLMQPRPGITNPARIVDVGRTQDGSGFDTSSYPNYVDLRDRNSVFSGLAGYEFEPKPMGLGSQGEAERIYGVRVSGNYFSVLGVHAAAGRFFAPDEDRVAGENRTAVLSYRFWNKQFHKDQSVIGSRIVLNGQQFAIVGVAGEEFRGTSILTPDVWIPFHSLIENTQLQNRDSVWLMMIGRLKPGIAIKQAQAVMSTLASSLEKQYPVENKGKGISVQHASAFPGDLKKMVSAFLGLIFVLCGLVLLIACVNLTGMILARQAARKRELALRLALGSGRFRLVRQLTGETLLLFVIGGAIGLWLAHLLLRLLPILVVRLPVPISIDFSLNWQVLLFSTVVTFIAGSISGLFPALSSTRTNIFPALKEEEASLGKIRLRSVLLCGQVSLSVLLLITAALFVRALQNAASIDIGFDPKNVKLAEFDLRLSGYQEQQALQFTDDLLHRISQLPGVTSAAFTRVLPLSNTGFSLGGVFVSGHQRSPESATFDADWNIITPDYFDALHLPLLEGRSFLESDRSGSLDVAIINKTMAKKFWPGESAIGKRFYDSAPPQGRVREIVGVVSDSKYRSLSEHPRFLIYVPLQQNYHPRMTLLVRSNRAQDVLPEVRRLTHQINPYLPIVNEQLLSDFIRIGLLPQQIAVSSAGSLGLIGLLLASIGVYGVTAYAVARRRREIAIRIAIGSQQQSVIRLILWDGMRSATIGIVTGLALALIVTQLLSGLLFGISPYDVTAFATSITLFLTITLLATYFPARQAASISPASILRAE